MPGKKKLFEYRVVDSDESLVDHVHCLACGGRYGLTLCDHGDESNRRFFCPHCGALVNRRKCRKSWEPAWSRRCSGNWHQARETARIRRERRYVAGQEVAYGQMHWAIERANSGDPAWLRRWEIVWVRKGSAIDAYHALLAERYGSVCSVYRAVPYHRSKAPAA
jgi:predicted RNA-binding Zn-ribbon protein involved in translation (DUF1610 family)